jgi:hypothetical protein
MRATQLKEITRLHTVYAGSIYGIHHAEQPLRYSQYYAYDRDSMLEDLGDDVHPVRHMAYTEAEIVVPLITVQNQSADEHFADEEATVIRAAALLHDIGECEHAEIQQYTGYRVGDVAWDLKTDEDGKSEWAIRQFLYSKLYTEIPIDFLEAADDIIDNKDGSLPREAFYTAERLGYYLTGLKAGEVALRLYEHRTASDELRVTQLGRLALQTTNDHRRYLEKRGERFPHIAEVLGANIRLDDHIQSKLDQFSEAGRT